MGPYRNKIDFMPKEDIPMLKEPKEITSFEEKIYALRAFLPGPIRRLMAIFLFLPIYVISFILAFFILAPVSWILFGDTTKWWDKTYYESSGYQYAECWMPACFVKGTIALFTDRLEFYRGIRTGKVKKARQ